MASLGASGGGTAERSAARQHASFAVARVIARRRSDKQACSESGIRSLPAHRLNIGPN